MDSAKKAESTHIPGEDITMHGARGLCCKDLDLKIFRRSDYDSLTPDTISHHSDVRLRLNISYAKA